MWKGIIIGIVIGFALAYFIGTVYAKGIMTGAQEETTGQ